MSTPIFGIEINQVDTEPRPATNSDMAVVGLVGPAPNADVDAFPVNEPVALFSDDTTMTVKLGAGAIRDAVELINNQLGETQVAARIVYVRTAVGGDDAETMTNIVGSSTALTGLWALTKSGEATGTIPRLIGVPGAYTEGYTLNPGTRTANSSIKSGGNTGNGLLTLANPATGVSVKAGIYQVRCTATAADGGTFSVKDPDNIALANATVGSAYAGAHLNFTIADGATDFAVGDGFDVTVAITPDTSDANPVVAALPAVLDRLLGVGVIAGPSDSLQHYQEWRESFQSDRLIPISFTVKVGVEATVQSGVPGVLGIGVRRDHEEGGLPSWSWANQPINGIVGVGRSVGFSYTDGATEGQQILALNGGICVRGQAGVEGAVATGGFVYIGTDTAAEDDLWRFYNVRRTRDYIHLQMIRTLKFYLGRYNLTTQTIEAILQTMGQILRDMEARQAIIDFRVGFTPSQNDPANLRAGKFTVDFKAEEAPVLRKIGINSARFLSAFDKLLTDLAAQLDSVV